MDNMLQIVVVLPTYNECANLAHMVDALFALQINNLRILIVDDNSPDGTGKIADSLVETHPDRVFVLHRQAKNGLGKAYLAGFNKALAMNPDVIIQMDADFSHDPASLPVLLKQLQHNDLVIGSRWMSGGSVSSDWKSTRWLLSWFANRIYIPFVLQLPFCDVTGGFRVWRSTALRNIDFETIKSSGYIFQAEMAYVTHKLGFRIQEVPIHFEDRKVGSSKMTFRIKAEAALRALMLRVQHGRLKPINAGSMPEIAQMTQLAE